MHEEFNSFFLLAAAAAAFEINFPQRPFTVHIPQITDTGMSDSQARSSILSHPLMVRQTEQASRSTSERTLRGRASRADRGLTRQHGNTIHIHGGNSGE